MQIPQTTHPVSFEDRMAHEAERTRAQARTMPPGKDRDALTERARQVEAAAQISEWLRSPTSKLPRRATFRAKVVTIAAIHRPADKPPQFRSAIGEDDR
jgi:hypothetical protein